MREMNKRGDAEGVIRSFESGRHGFTEEAVKEYVKALVAVDRLDRSSLLKTLQAGLSAQSGGGGGLSAFGGYGGNALGGAGAQAGLGLGPGVGGMLAAGGSQELGSANQPVHVTQAEPTFMAQFWKSVRSLGLAFIVISGIGALMEDKGVPSRFLSGNGEVRPVLESDTKFEDVKGVDEAKQELVEIVEYLKGPERFTPFSVL